MQRAVDHYLEVCRQRGEDPERPFSGKLNVRLGSELHRAAVIAATAEGESLNNWLVRVVEAAARSRVDAPARRSYTKSPTQPGVPGKRTRKG
jgi:predicted HicB family RNase H-like nuclease